MARHGTALAAVTDFFFSLFFNLTPQGAHSTQPGRDGGPGQSHCPVGAEGAEVHGSQARLGQPGLAQAPPEASLRASSPPVIITEHEWDLCAAGPYSCSCL